MDPAAIVPPDDSGSDAFSRFCYQAHVAFRYCLDCALGGDVLCVIMEHVEDIAVERLNGWQFKQIKTRNPELGPWRLSDITGTGGALRALLRSHRALAGAPVTLELFVEGALLRDDPITLLCSEQGRLDAALHTRLLGALAIEDQECAAFLQRVRLIPNLPARTSIVGDNLRLLADQAGYLAADTLRDLYERVIGRIEAAMTAGRLEPQWWASIMNGEPIPDGGSDLVAAKRLDRALLRSLIAPITRPPRPLLKRLVADDGERATTLEQKLLIGGATGPIIATAKSLRAQAAIQELEGAAARLWDQQDLLDDVRERLRIHAEAIRELHADRPRPAVHIWNALLAQLPGLAGALDAYGLFRADPHLLLGELCQMADLCQADWGTANA